MALKKITALFVCLTLSFFATSLFFAYKAFFPAITYIVFVDDALYDAYSTILDKSQPEGFALLPRGAGLPDDTKSRVIVAAYLTLKSELPLLEKTFATGKKNESRELYYLIEEKTILPAVQADFSKAAAKNPAVEPRLNIQFCSDEIPPGHRALPVENEYAGSEQYALTARLYACCVLFDTRVQEYVQHFCDQTFAQRLVEKKERTVFIASVGDMMVSRGAQDVLIHSEDGLETVFGSTLPLLQHSDFTMGNLEGVVTASWKNAIKTYTFKFDKRVLPKLQEAGFDYLMQTNNHSYDFGENGFKDTLRAFAEYNIPSSGIGYTATEARAFYHTDVGGVPLAIISCGAFPAERSGFNGKVTATATQTRAGILWESDTLLEDIAAEKEKGYVVIVNVHGGEEYVFEPTKTQRALYESFCDSGARIVFGSHPHVLQDTEWYNDSLIVFSQGNFIFNGMEEMPGATESEVVRVGIFDKKIAYIEQYPAALDGFTVSLAQ